MNLQIKAIEAIPHSITLGECLKDGPVTQVFICAFEGIKAVIRLDLPVSQTLGLDRYSEIELLKFVNDNKIDVTFVGPEQPLENGVVDFFELNQHPIFGPNKFSSQLETSKLFARYIMEKYYIPQPAFFELDIYISRSL